MSGDINKHWFEDWFDSPYYHILYKKHSCSEAELFIDNLIHFLKPESKAEFLDLACGKGRHSIYLNKKGYKVTGMDLSQESISYASKFENEKLNFFVQDMRKINQVNKFNYIMNLFTSFGYFENEADDFETIKNLSKALRPNGIFVLDFMNVKKVLSNLVPAEIKMSGGIEFTVTRTLENNFIIKRIHFSDNGQEYNFQERVKAISLNEFEKYFTAGGLKIIHLRGSYNLEEFNPETSDRLIIFAQKE